MDRLLKQTARICPNFHASNDWFILHDNVCWHNNVTSTRRFLLKKTSHGSSPPPICQICLPADYFLSPKLKLKGYRFDDVLTIQENVTTEWKAITEEEYKHALESLVKRAQQCMNLDGIYIE